MLVTLAETGTFCGGPLFLPSIFAVMIMLPVVIYKTQATALAPEKK